MADYPQRFGPYVLERFLAAGGMAEVFVATRPDGKITGQLALKRMLPQMMENPEYAAMFRDEAALAGKLLHPNIVRVFDSGEYDGRLYMAMELVEGLDASSLQKKLRAKNEMLGLAQALRVGIELCGGLAAAHALKDERGVAQMIIHRDVSPQNILISRQGVVKVTDFGVAKATGRETHTATGNIKGKIPYMAPEQALAQHIDQRVDQFAAGIVVWELLTATRLFHDKNDLLMFEKIIRRPTPKPSSVRAGIPASVDNAILRALAKNPDERFPDVASFGRALLKCLNEMGGWDAAALAPIVEYVLGPPVNPAQPAAQMETAKPPSSPSQSPARSTGTPASRPTGAPVSAATLDDDEHLTQNVAPPRAMAPIGQAMTPRAPATAPPSQPMPLPPPTATPGTPRPAARPRGLSVVGVDTDLTVQRDQSSSSGASSGVSSGPPASLTSSSSSPSSPSAPALTLDHARMRTQNRPSGIESQQQGGPMPAVPMMAPTPTPFPIAVVVIAVVVGAGLGFGGARLTAPKEVAATAGVGCARPSTATADVEAAYDLLLKAKGYLDAGDVEKAATRINEAQTRSGTARGHYLLGRLRLQSGDVAAGVNHYRCVLELGPGSDEAKAVALALGVNK